jgi:hypothetical protein
MEMIIHQAVEKDPNTVTSDALRQPLAQRPPVTVIQEYPSPTVPPHGDVINRSAIFNSQRSSHINTLSKTVI